MKKYLVLEDGTTYCGTAFGAETEAVGELAFSTGMSGYQELISDPASNGLILNFTAPIIGNSGINKKFNEADKLVAHGVVVNQLADAIGNYQSEMSLEAYLKAEGVPGITGIDTRSVMLKLREQGTMRAALVNQPDTHWSDKIKNFRLDKEQLSKSWGDAVRVFEGEGKHLVLLDCGVGHSLVRVFNKEGFRISVVPHTYTLDQIKALEPDAIVLSDGPGTPTTYTPLLEVIKALQKAYPLLGIGLGHQLLCMANGAQVEPLKAGHHGFNYSVKDLRTHRNFFTAQNFRYVVAEGSLKNTDLELTHVGLHDNTVQGVQHTKYKAFSFQFHPEATPGPHDAHFLIDEFTALI